MAAIVAGCTASDFLSLSTPPPLARTMASGFGFQGGALRASPTANALS
jgi:hypothetical protein